MGEDVMGSLVRSCNKRWLVQLSGGEWKGKQLSFRNLKPREHLLMVESKSRSQMMMITNQMVKPTTYSSKIITDIPLSESPAEEWRIQMLPIHFLLLTVWPVIDMRLRCKSKGIDYPPGVPRDITKVVEVEIIRWELQGLDDFLKPSEFTLGVKGALYSDRRESLSRLKIQLKMSISFVLPAVLALVPEDVHRGIVESVLDRLVENAKHRVNGSLLADYSEFKREKLNAIF
ncbi:uncharacterized protein LOC114282462 isoform X2 [Camellia sinensis]|uniref:uncharacterized protein LOC114282462 isoform X2 n=1 Tax=Camellia sinensis TaxID=4442 RepID=UPI0010367E5A|nr:uncharacterized protein LOC114282462 isoform X2 [Camellia sinensis]